MSTSPKAIAADAHPSDTPTNHRILPKMGYGVYHRKSNSTFYGASQLRISYEEHVADDYLSGLLDTIGCILATISPVRFTKGE